MSQLVIDFTIGALRQITRKSYPTKYDFSGEALEGVIGSDDLKNERISILRV